MQLLCLHQSSPISGIVLEDPFVSVDGQQSALIHNLQDSEAYQIDFCLSSILDAEWVRNVESSFWLLQKQECLMWFFGFLRFLRCKNDLECIRRSKGNWACQCFTLSKPVSC